DDMTITPRSSKELSVEVSLAGRRGSTRNKIAIESNDPSSPRTVLHMQGIAASSLVATPSKVRFGSLPVDAQLHTDFVVRYLTDNKPIGLRSFSSSDDSIEVTRIAGENSAE